MADVVSRYLSFLGAGTGEDIAGLFAADAVVEDPVGGQILQGRDALTSFYSRVTAAENSAELLTLPWPATPPRSISGWSPRPRTR
ncbi:nuclear transport factor 2 family protein [Gordonia rubripertincta]|uniref:nuclear transport factor 2 family protein n=1 Tax=Gordonia rubripertincta TaxID=36822 RepID=UPI000B8D68E5|nr:nuclear transport factor 2 family protein [Gordonia rubripertincta]ASR02268.1 Steroid Delta-isomerase [Gordonia rubripertincta]